MSVVRTGASRSDARRQNASPYARSRGLVGKILRVFGLRRLEEDESDIPMHNPPNTQPVAGGVMPNNTWPQAHSTHPTSAQPTFGNRQPLTQVDYSNTVPRRAMDPPSSSLLPDTRSVANYFTQKTGTPIDAKIVESIVTTLQTTPEKNEFKFEFTSPFPSNPHLTPDTTPSSTPLSSRRLAKNPNGSYKWEGGGSAKRARSRNRYHSPAFGASPAKSERLVMKESNVTNETDGKRRRVNDNSPPVASQSSGPSVPFPANGSPSPPPLNNSSSARSAAASRLRTPAKPTAAPVVPSPLRQTWSEAFPSSSREDLKRSATQHLKPTKTANFMAELIKETTPPKKPDLSNPYQTASPVGKVGPPRRSTRRTRATGRPAAPPKEDSTGEDKRKNDSVKIDEVSPQAIIAATVPQGSKRSRPPTHFEREVNEVSQRENPYKAYVVEEPEEDDGSSRSAKRAKPTLNGNGRPSTLFDRAQTPPPDSDVRIEEVEEYQGKGKGKAKENGAGLTNGNGDVTVAAAKTNALTARSSFSAIPRTSSKLRQSFQADESASPAPVLAPLPEPKPKPATTASFFFSPTPTPVAASTPAAPVPAILSAPANLVFAAPTPAASVPAAAAAAPSFFFNPAPAASASAAPAPAASFFAAPTQVASAPAAAPSTPASTAGSFAAPSGAFNFTFKSSGTEAPVSPETDKNAHLTRAEVKVQVSNADVNTLPTFTFTFAGNLESASSARVRSDVKVLPPVSLPTFDFGTITSTGFKFDLTPPRLASVYHAAASFSPPRSDVPPIQGFNFAAAGLAPPTAKKDVWKCSTCAVENKNSASKCVCCEEPAPSSVVAGPSVPAAAPKPSVGFNFAAAGFKMPVVPGAWTCSECLVSNPGSAVACGACQTDRK